MRAPARARQAAMRTNWWKTRAPSRLCHGKPQQCSQCQKNATCFDQLHAHSLSSRNRVGDQAGYQGTTGWNSHNGYAAFCLDFIVAERGVPEEDRLAKTEGKHIHAAAQGTADTLLFSHRIQARPALRAPSSTCPIPARGILGKNAERTQTASGLRPRAHACAHAYPRTCVGPSGNLEFQGRMILLISFCASVPC
jgi:hypothetical protein